MKPLHFGALFVGGLLSAISVRAQPPPVPVPVGLRCENLTDPQGLDAAHPRLNWQLPWDGRGRRQTGYQIEAASTPQRLALAQNDLWDSGKVPGGQSVNIAYAGKALTSGQPCWWRVRAWDERGRASAWSRPARWSMGLLRPMDWEGQWIGMGLADGQNLGNSRVLPARYLRREFDVTGPVRRATVSFSGLGLSELSLNGLKVGDAVLSPALSQYDKRCYYVTYDVTPSLRPGRNALGVVLGNGRFFAPRLKIPTATRDFGPPRLLLQMNVLYEDGSTAHVVSDGRWMATDRGPIRADNEYDGEDYDARREMPGWDRPGFRDTAWQDADVLPAPGGVLSALTMYPIKVVRTLRPIARTRPAPGVWIFDMGQNMAGWCRLTVSGPAGTQVTLRHAERLRADGTLYTDNLRSATQTDHYTLRGGGPEVYQPRFTTHGFRYVEVSGFPGTPTLATLQGEVARDSVPSAGNFVCSNPLVNQIYHNVLWGVADNYRSIPTDCPQRDERQGWMGDRSAESTGESYLFDVEAFYDKWVQDMADAQRPDGALSDVCPAYWPLYNDGVTWPSSVILIPNMLSEQYGDTGVPARQYPAMQRWMGHMRGYLADGLMPRDTYGDWCAPPNSLTEIHPHDPTLNTNGTLIGTAYYVYCLRLLAHDATILGKPADAEADVALAETMQTAFNARFLDASGVYANGSATSSILPLALGLTPADRQAQVSDALVRSIESRGGHVNNGLVGGQWLMRTLTANGHADLAYQILTQTTYPSWGYMVKNGATTIWELWNGDTANPAMNSGNHVMLVGDMVTWLYEDLAGIAPDPAQPGFRHIVMRPHPVGDLTFVQATHNCPYGAIRSAWHRNGRRFTWQITVPANTTATVYVPSGAVHMVGSGQYVFRSSLAAPVAALRGLTGRKGA